MQIPLVFFAEIQYFYDHFRRLLERIIGLWALRVAITKTLNAEEKKGLFLSQNNNINSSTAFLWRESESNSFREQPQWKRQENELSLHTMFFSIDRKKEHFGTFLILDLR